MATYSEWEMCIRDRLYVTDERFTAYYDRAVSGCARCLRDAVECWAR